MERVRTASAGSVPLMQDSARLRLAHLDSTFDMLVAAGRAESAVTFAVAMNPHWTRLTDYSTALKQQRRALALNSTPSATRAVALRQAAFIAFRGGDTATAAMFYRQMMDVGIQIGDSTTIASSHSGMARLAARARDFTAAIQHARIGAQLSASLHDPRSRIGPYHVLAFAHRLAGHYEEAARLYEYTIALYGLTGNSAGVATEMLNLGFVRLHQHDTASAGKLFSESLSALRSAHSADQMYLLGAFAALAAVQHQSRRAALLYGAMDTALAEKHVVLDPDDQGELDTYSQLARRQMSPPTFAAARSEGRNLSLDAAVTLALSKY